MLNNLLIYLTFGTTCFVFYYIIREYRDNVFINTLSGPNNTIDVRMDENSLHFFELFIYPYLKSYDFDYINYFMTNLQIIFQNEAERFVLRYNKLGLFPPRKFITVKFYDYCKNNIPSIIDNSYMTYKSSNF